MSQLSQSLYFMCWLGIAMVSPTKKVERKTQQNNNVRSHPLSVTPWTWILGLEFGPSIPHPCRSLQLTLQEPLASELASNVENLKLPSTALLYDSRITIDMATMLFARETIFSQDAPGWVLHLRADSSPQFGRDFLVIQGDVVTFGVDASTTSIRKRLLPLQCVGSRSAGAHQKLQKLIFALTLESEHVSLLWKLLITCSCYMCLIVSITSSLWLGLFVPPEVLYTAERVCSLLTDFGVESQSWLAPASATDHATTDADDNADADADPSLLFRYCMPLPDLDHSLHHVTVAYMVVFGWYIRILWFGIGIRLGIKAPG